MAEINIKKIRARINQINNAWAEGDPNAEFGGIKQPEFQTRIAAAEALDAELDDLQAQIDLKKAQRVQTYAALDDDAVRVANGVRGHKDHGDDSPLYGAMGFVRTSERASGLTRKSKSSGAKS